MSRVQKYMVDISFYNNEILHASATRHRRGSYILGSVLSLAIVLIGWVGAYAAIPPLYGLHDGDQISVLGSSDTHTYIINDWGYKRVMLNPSAMYNMYGHLSLSTVHTVPQSTSDAFWESGLYRNCETGDLRVFGLEKVSANTGVLHWVNIAGDVAVSQDAHFFQKVFCINSAEFSSYSQGSEYSSVSQIPGYSQGTPGPVAHPQ